MERPTRNGIARALHGMDAFAMMEAMMRPCYLVMDREYSGNISTRKLVIETGKFNVITAYSAEETVETLRTFPAVAGVVLDAALDGTTCAELCQELRAVAPKVPIVAIHAPRSDGCVEADHHLDSFDPAKLLELLRRLKPVQAAEIDAREAELSNL